MEIEDEAREGMSMVDKNTLQHAGEKFERLGEDSKGFGEKMQDLGVKEKESTIKWRARFSIFMMALLVIQYAVVVSLLVLQGFGWWGFKLDNLIFYFLISGTLAESYFLVRIIFQHLFSIKK